MIEYLRMFLRAFWRGAHARRAAFVIGGQPFRFLALGRAPVACADAALLAVARLGLSEMPRESYEGEIGHLRRIVEEIDRRGLVEQLVAAFVLPAHRSEREWSAALAGRIEHDLRRATPAEREMLLNVAGRIAREFLTIEHRLGTGTTTREAAHGTARP